MLRRFNTAGPNDPQQHYTLPTPRRLPEARGLIDRQLYFVVHAPKQMGKTTSLYALAHELTLEGTYAAVPLAVDAADALPAEVGAAEIVILEGWRKSAARLPPVLRPPPWPNVPPGHRIRTSLMAWSRAVPKPLVLFADDIDALHDDVRMSVLRQLRGGYRHRPKAFPWSIVIAGRSGTTDRGRSFRAFDVSAKSLTLGQFTYDDVASLYAQHTQRTGRVFLPEAVERVFELTGGRPGPVNAIGQWLVSARGRKKRLGREDVDAARDALCAHPPPPDASRKSRRTGGLSRWLDILCPFRR